MSSIRVDVPGRAPEGYDVDIHPGGLDRLADVCRSVPAHRYAVIADSRVARLYGRRALAVLEGGGLEALLLTFPAGEWNKSAEQWSELCAALVGAGVGRDGACVALGGGVTGDLAGFVTSTYMRGIPVVHVPTTLLAMLDSSVGGKTGIDVGTVKNAIGTFHHPAAVLVDPELLSTLPKHQRISGLAEAVKVAAVADASLLEWIESRADELRDGEVDSTTELIARSVRIKAAVVQEDPTELGRREILNLGHTFGHAFESASGFSVLHGEAVSAGMRIEARIGEELGITERGTAGRLDRILGACGLPEVLDASLDIEALLERARPDKKARGGDLRWVLLASAGTVARAPDGAYAHAIPAIQCREVVRTALRSALEASDSLP